MSPLPTRKPNRLPFKELYQVGHWYFVTICVQDRQCIFVGESPCFPNPQSNSYFPETEITTTFPNPQPSPRFSSTSKFMLNQNGEILKQEWLVNLNFYTNIILDEYVIMPNHFHGIIGFNGVPTSKNTQKPTNLFKIISAFKSSSYRKIKSLHLDECIDQHDLSEFNVAEIPSLYGKQGLSPTVEFLIQKYNSIWQKSFYDHIIRNDKDLDRIREYILNNPLNWKIDSLNPVNYKDGRD